MLTGIKNALFGCLHKNITFPRQIRDEAQRRRLGAPPCKVDHYVVCNDCGKEMPYNWTKMRIVKPEQWPLPSTEDLSDDRRCLVA